LKDLTDYELLIKIKSISNLEDKKKYKEELYNRIKPYIMKHSSKFASSSSINKNYYYEYNDHVSDCYEYFEEAISKFDPEKVYTKDSYKFIGFFDYCYKRNTMLKRRKYNKTFSVSHSYPDFKEEDKAEKEKDGIKKMSCNKAKRIYSVSSMSNKAYAFNDNLYTFEEEYIDKFYKKLTDRQIKILDYRKQGLTLTKIAKNLKISYASVHRDLDFCRRDFNIHFSTNFRKIDCR